MKVNWSHMKGKRGLTEHGGAKEIKREPIRAGNESNFSKIWMRAVKPQQSIKEEITGKEKSAKVYKKQTVEKGW